MAKTVNYTPEMTAYIVAESKSNPTKDTVAVLAVAAGKTTRSIIAKLSREGVYKAAEYVNKNGEKPEPKAEIVEEIASLLGVASETLGGLDKATKAALTLIRDALTPAAVAVETETGETA